MLGHRWTNRRFPVLIPIADVLALIPIARSTLYLRMAEPDFPKPVRIGGRVFWKQEEILAYIDLKKDVEVA
jgi:predicted DNA-binding transcriptional regulator AlpA